MKVWTGGPWVVGGNRNEFVRARKSEVLVCRVPVSKVHQTGQVNEHWIDCDS